ncbi:hypothetical protein NEOLEDRAFT_1096755 [Neolentinus lepideus HHB14362 ss-1]|uniref:protein-tyrosine-phosphatase n=1 Tax=Neolentinus lepideus HHB14362 ss-1 TaxID=1314782 RepID=A0A165QY71_9AGAM|nr:hypothetical protein NEOLEDRAFT_1096755 [Neolentinus lepideus HHB14362 ss-1]
MHSSVVAGPSRSTGMSAGKKAKPPNLTIGRPTATNTVLEFESPIDLGDDDDDRLSLSSPSSSSSGSPVASSLNFTDSDATSDDLSKDLAVLEELRRSVRKNLRLRPIRSASHLRLAQPSPHHPFEPPSRTWSELSDSSPASSSASVASPGSVYYTPSSEPRYSPLSSARFAHDPSPRSTSPNTADGLDPSQLLSRLTASARPLLIDTRPVASYLSSRIRHSVNIAIPSLILKRCRKPNGGFQSLDALRQFITTEEGKDTWDELMCPDGMWDGDVIVYDEEMDTKGRDSVNSTAWALLGVLTPLLRQGSVTHLRGGLSAARHNPDLRYFIISGDGDDFLRAGEEGGGAVVGGGLFQLDTQSALRSKVLPEIEAISNSPPDSPTASMPSVMSSSSLLNDATPSPPPSHSVFRRPPPPRRPSVPQLGRLDTKSAERLKDNLPKLQVRTLPVKANTLAAPPSATFRAHSPSHLNIYASNYSPPGSARWLPPSPGLNGSSEYLPPPSPFFSRSNTPHSPSTPMPRSPSTARPDTDQPPTTEEPFPVFTVSTILPGFLYLGPEPAEREHVKELQKLGVTRILNIAEECDDNQGLHLRENFERYIRIPMRDTVEEDNITRGVREACQYLDDARLHSAPTYVHCKAGKSRSVTAVMAYLIHANHWTLSRAYAFVLERRKGISPNIGFVSELMTFEEQELGTKSMGVIKSAGGNVDHAEDGESAGMSGNYGVAASGRRQGPQRESLPPAFMGPNGDIPHLMSADGVARVGDSGQEVEIKDSSGRYRHARRAPVDENTLQPLRRVSKAGLETSVYS